MLRSVGKRFINTGACLWNKFPPPLVHATGLEKRELLAKLSGNNDPFYNGPFKKAAGTRQDPYLVHSAFRSRIVGCICEPEQHHAVWMWVEIDMPRRCGCGHWFKLVSVQPV